MEKAIKEVEKIEDEHYRRLFEASLKELGELLGQTAGVEFEHARLQAEAHGRGAQDFGSGGDTMKTAGEDDASYYKALIEECQLEMNTLNEQMDHRERNIDRLSDETQLTLNHIKEILKCGNHFTATS